jgi:hypothetical protein
MNKKILAALAGGFIAATSLAGCYSTGKVTGEAAEGVEHGAHEFKKGYEEGKR